MDLGLTTGEIVLSGIATGYALLRWSAARNIQAEDAFKAEVKTKLQDHETKLHDLKTQRLEDTASFRQSIDKLSSELNAVKKEVESFSSSLVASVQRLEASFRADMTKLVRLPSRRK